MIISGHGPVSDWRRAGWRGADKRPGERPLVTDHGSTRFYDWKAAIEIAKRDGWGAPEKVRKEWDKKGIVPTKGMIAEAAVQADYEWLKAWCEDRWHWACVHVVLLDDDGEEMDFVSYSVAGICSEDKEGILMYAKELAGEVLSEICAVAA